MQRIQILLIVFLTLALSVRAQNFDPLATNAALDTIQSVPSTPLQQTTARQRRAQQEKMQETSKGGVSTRAKNYADQQVKDTDTAPWRRVVYRQLPIDSISNAPIFHPLRPSGDLQSLTMGMSLYMNTKILGMRT